jgi:hypothetical protein
MAKKRRLRSYVLDALSKAVMTIDEVIDTLAYPLIEKGFIEPMMKTIPEKEVEPDRIRDEIRRILDAWLKPIQKQKAPIPVALAIIGGILFIVGQRVFGALLDPMLESYFTHAGNYAFRPTLISAEQILEAHRRGIIPDRETRDKFLAYAGISSFLISVLDKLQWYVPTATDVIRFGVREVYTPEVVRKFRMDEGFDEVVKNAEKDLASAGLDPETFRKYWRAHWELPSFTQGIEMFHRGIISYDELKLLLRTLDVMPFWQDKLIQMAYEIPTRVDIRRMHKLGLISNEELVGYYHKLGYTEEDAKKLAEFTIRYNQNPEWTEQTQQDQILWEYRNRAKTEIVQAYVEGILTEEQCRKQLREIGLVDEAIEYEISLSQYDRVKKLFSPVISAVGSAYRKGLLTEKDVYTQLGSYNLPSSYIEHLISVWNIQMLERPKEPTKADIIDWFKKELIDEQTAMKLLVGLGYEMKYVELYISEAKYDVEKAKKPKTKL